MRREPIDPKGGSGGCRCNPAVALKSGRAPSEEIMNAWRSYEAVDSKN
jgi:hypothetical protein